MATDFGGILIDFGYIQSKEAYACIFTEAAP